MSESRPVGTQSKVSQEPWKDDVVKSTPPDTKSAGTGHTGKERLAGSFATATKHLTKEKGTNAGRSPWCD